MNGAGWYLGGLMSGVFVTAIARAWLGRHNDGRGHAFEPGVNSDGDPPNPAWCNVCGERHKDGQADG